MHLLKIDESGALYDSDEAVDLAQPPAEIIILTSADTEVSLLSKAVARRASEPHQRQVRIANYLSLNHPYSVDLYIENTAKQAQIVLVRLLGGTGYWSYGVQQLRALAETSDVQLVFLSGDGKPDPELQYLSSFDAAVCDSLSAYLDAGGLDNAVGFLQKIDDCLDATDQAPPVRPLLRAGLYWPDLSFVDLDAVHKQWQDGAAVAAVVFYRALMQAGDTAPIDSVIDALRLAGLNPLPLFAASLKDPESAAIVADSLQQANADIILNLTSFAVSDASQETSSQETFSGIAEMHARDRSVGPFGAVDAPVLQVVLAANRQQDWAQSSAGLTARDLAMNVALPELDGRILSRAIGFKGALVKHPLTHAMTTSYEADQSRVSFVAALAARWCRLRHKPNDEKHVGFILANYPNKDGRIANGVGLDTPQSVVNSLQALAADGYDFYDLPADAAGLIDALRAGPTNAGWQGRKTSVKLSVQAYKNWFCDLPADLGAAVLDRWGAVEADPMCDGTDLHLPILLFGNAAVGVQPARGYNIDPKATYHAPDLVPPHNYFAFYMWLRHSWGCDAIVHYGKHGNLEWLPGKALALSANCFPEAVLGPIPHLYPFIVNDPGEGAQAKRRCAAVVIDHLTPPLTQAGSHGVMAEIESLMDEYFEAAGMDKARSAALMVDILEAAERAGIAADCGINEQDGADEKLLKLDNFLCDIKELQIRDGLHIFGVTPSADQQISLLTQMLRTPRGDGAGENASLLRALAADLGLVAGADDDFDPLTAIPATLWHRPRPAILAEMGASAWRSNGDTVERLDALAHQMVAAAWHQQPLASLGPESAKILSDGLPLMQIRLAQCGAREMLALRAGLAGAFVAPGPSGAPTRGRPEVLPTGRNFFSIDSRALPTPVAWRLGWASANALLDRYVLDHGNWPRAMVLSAWGTSNMRTGGDDIAQALALMGVRPSWDTASRRVTGFEIIPLEVLGRPRVDVSLRCSGFFRDAFPAQMSLIDRAVQAVAACDETDEMNPLAATARAEAAALQATGIAEKDAMRRSTMRIFSAKPGAYGAGLQTLIDEGVWSDRGDFAEAFLTWSSYAYGESLAGVDARQDLESRLRGANAILHNQDNREHDILDSDDYYQFAGGLSAAVAHLSGHDVPIYHNDHSLPERPVIRSLAEEISRVVRGRASNPKWIAGAMRHGYKGAFEMAATVDYLFAFAATTRIVEPHHFAALYEAYIEDETVRSFLQQANDAAYADMLARFAEAIERGLWTPRRNSVQADLDTYRQRLAQDA